MSHENRAQVSRFNVEIRPDDSSDWERQQYEAPPEWWRHGEPSWAEERAACLRRKGWQARVVEEDAIP